MNLTAPSTPPASPPVELGELLEGGLAPAILPIIERGARHRPELARRLMMEVELVVAGGHPPVRIRLRGIDGITVEDGAAAGADVRITGELPDVVALLVTPLLAGVPSPIDRRGRATLGRLAGRRIRLEGRIGLLRAFLALIRI